MVRLTAQLLRREFKYWKRYMWREMYRHTPRRIMFLPLVGWKEDIKRGWNVDENQPWSQEFHEKNKPWSPVKKTYVEPLKDWPYIKGDRVEVLVGPDKGKQGVISYMVKKRNWVFVEGLNLEYLEYQPDKSMPPYIMLKERPYLVPHQVVMVDPGDNLPTEVDWRYTEEGERVRVSSRTGRIIPVPTMGEQLEDYVYPTAYVEGKKDTKEKQLTEVTFVPKLKTFDEDIMESMGIEEDRKPVKTYWY